MGRKIELTDKRLQALMAMLLEVGDKPIEDFDLPAADLDFDIPDFIAAPAVSASAATVKDSLPACGTHPICIRVPVWVLRAFKAKAAECGRNYQSLMLTELGAAARALR